MHRSCPYALKFIVKPQLLICITNKLLRWIFLVFMKSTLAIRFVYSCHISCFNYPSTCKPTCSVQIEGAEVVRLREGKFRVRKRALREALLLYEPPLYLLREVTWYMAVLNLCFADNACWEKVISSRMSGFLVVYLEIIAKSIITWSHLGRKWWPFYMAFNQIEHAIFLEVKPSSHYSSHLTCC